MEKEGEFVVHSTNGSKPFRSSDERVLSEDRSKVERKRGNEKYNCLLFFTIYIANICAQT